MDKKVKKSLKKLVTKVENESFKVDNFVPAVKKLMDQTEKRQEDTGDFINQSQHLEWFRKQTAKSHRHVVYDYTSEYEAHLSQKKSAQKSPVAEEQKNNDDQEAKEDPKAAVADEEEVSIEPSDPGADTQMDATTAEHSQGVLETEE